MIGIGAAFAFSALDPRVQREEQLREVFGRVPILAEIPRVGRKQRPGPLVPDQLTMPAIEGYRTLRTTLSTRADGEPGPTCSPAVARPKARPPALSR